MEKCCIFFEVRTEFVNDILTNLGFKGLNISNIRKCASGWHLLVHMCESLSNLKHSLSCDGFEKNIYYDKGLKSPSYALKLISVSRCYGSPSNKGIFKFRSNNNVILFGLHIAVDCLTVLFRLGRCRLQPRQTHKFSSR
jgi:hypothetical protein